MALTMDQLNAVYNDMSVYGDTYKNSIAPMAVNTNVASIPNVAQINNIKPYLPIINQGGNDGGGITTINNRIDSNNPIFRDPFNNILENYIQENEVNPNEFLEKYSDKMFNVQETKSKGMGIQSLIDVYKKFSPLGMLYRAGKSGIETAQKYFADKKEDQRLFEIREAKKAIEQREAQAAIAAAEEQATREAATAARARAANPNVYASADAQGFTSNGGGFASQNTGTNENFSNNTGRGRTGYGTGGIVSL